MLPFLDYRALGPSGSGLSVTNKTASTSKNTLVNIDLTGSGGTISSYAIVTGFSHGTSTISGATLTYSPYYNYVGSDSATFRAAGPAGYSNTATISMTVNDTPTPPSLTVTISPNSGNIGASGSMDLTSTVTGATGSVTRSWGVTPTTGTASLSTTSGVDTTLIWSGMTAGPLVVTCSAVDSIGVSGSGEADFYP